MNVDRIKHINELSIILRWLRHRRNLSRRQMEKYELLHVEAKSMVSLGIMLMHDRRVKCIEYLISGVEHDLKTLATHGKAEGTKGRKNK